MTIGNWSGTDDPTTERWHGDLLAIDPGVRSPGVALFRHGCLIATERLKVPHLPGCDGKKIANCEPGCIHALPAGQRWLRIGNEITAWWLEQREGREHYVRTVIYECPQIYSEREGKSKGDPNQLLGLVGVGQSTAVLITAFNLHKGVRPPELLNPQPGEWTGQLPKTVKQGGKSVIPKDPRESPRGQRIWSRLEPAEQVVAEATLQNDAWDGIGLGLHALKRYNRARVFPGAV